MLLVAIEGIGRQPPFLLDRLAENDQRDLEPSR